MKYEAMKFDSLLGTPGFSDALLKNHFTLYEGYVTNTNKLIDSLSSLQSAGKGGTPEFNEQKRRFGWEFNGMRLHEYYFSNLTKSSSSLDGASPLAKKIKDQFGSIEAWTKDFQDTGVMRGIGWVLLAHDPVQDVLLNTWIDEHDKGILAGSSPILIMDVFEHAFMLDYGLKRKDYIESFFKAINWPVAGDRYGKSAAKL